MVSTFAEIFAEQVGLTPAVQDLTLYQGSAWYPGMHVATATYTKAFYAQIRLLASDASAIVTMSSHNGGVKHWGHDFFASDFAAGTVWKTFSLIIHQSDAEINDDLADKYGQSDSQCGGLLDLFLSAQQTAALTFSKAGYDIDMIPLAKTSGATIDMATGPITYTLSNDGGTTIGGIAVGKLTATAGTPFAVTNISVGDLVYFSGGTISLANTWDLVANNSRFYRIAVRTSDTVIEIDRPWPVADAAGTTITSMITTGLPLQMCATADIRPWMDADEDDYTNVLLIDGDDEAGGTKLTFTSATFDLGAGDFQLAVGDIVLVTGQEDIASGDVDISGLQTVTAVTTGAGSSDVTFAGVTAGNNRAEVTDIVITKLHEALIARIQGGQITLDDSHAHGY